MATIVPAILEETKEAFNQKLSLVTKISGVERVQVDFGDGEFIPFKLVGPDEIDALNPAFMWEAHLMCKNPKDFLDYQICGFKTIIVHTESYAGETELLDAIAHIKALNLTPGVAISPETPVETLSNLEGAVNHFLLLGVTPGKQGQAFIPEVLGKIVSLRKIYPHAIIEIDGGVNETNIKSIKEAGADLIVAGSAIVKAANPGEAFERLRAEMGRNI